MSASGGQGRGKDASSPSRPMRSWVCLLLSLSILLAVPTAAAHADDGLATIRVEQRDAHGDPVTGGCYHVGSTVDAKDGCDSEDGATDSGVGNPGLQPGSYLLREYRAPAGYHFTDDFTVELGADQIQT